MAKAPLADLQKQMINFLTVSDNAIEKRIIDQGNISNQTRLNIYKNAYQVRLKEVIDNDHQMLGIYLGDDLFEQMVTGYIQQNPSNYTSLRHYADSLPRFLASTPPFNNHPILSELAHFERLLLVAFDAADATRLSRAALQQIPPQDWSTLVFKFHPSVQLAHFQWNAVQSWQALKNEQAPEPASEISNSWLLWRNHDKLTEFRSLSAQELQLIQMILQGNDFSALCDSLLASATEEEVSHLALNYLMTWIDQGILRAV